MTDAQALRCERIAADLAALTLDERAHVAQSLASRVGGNNGSIGVGGAPDEVVDAAALPGQPTADIEAGAAWRQAHAHAWAGQVMGGAWVATAHRPIEVVADKDAA